MLSYLIEIAKRKGLEGLTAWFWASNTRMMHVFKKSRYPIKYSVDGDLYHLNLDFKQKAEHSQLA